MGRSIDSDYEDSYETYNIISQMKKLKPAELKNLFEAMVNSLTIPTKEGLVFLVWESLEPHERDLFNFPSNDIYSDSIKDSYLEIFQHNQPLSSIWNNNDILRRNRIRTRNIFSNTDDDFDSYTRRRLDFSSIFDHLFNTDSTMNITPESLDSFSSFNSDSNDTDSTTDASNSDNDSNHGDDNELETILFSDSSSNSNTESVHSNRNLPSLTRRQLLRRYDRINPQVISTPTTIYNSNYPYLRPRMSLRSSANNSSGVTSTRFVSTERRTMTVDNNDIRTFHIVSRNRARNREDSGSDSDDDSDASNNNNNTINRNRRFDNNDSSENINTIHLSAGSENQHSLTNNNYIYTTSTEPRNILPLSLSNENDSNNDNETITNSSSISTIDRTTTANS